jgi:CIC family chloride channel protein
MLCEGVAFALCRRTKLYVRQVRNPLESPAHAGDLAIDVLASLRVADVCDPKARVKAVPRTMPLSHLLDQLADTHNATFPVSDENGQLVGMVSLATLRGVLDEEVTDHHRILVGDAMDRLVTVDPSDALSTALDRLLSSGYAELPVFDANDPSSFGLVGHPEIVNAYNRELARRRALFADETKETT